MITTEEAKELDLLSARLRLELVRMFSFGRAHHFGGSLSCADMVSALFFHKMNYSAAKLKEPERDRFIMSKGHSVPTQYVALSMLGILPHAELETIKRLGSRLQGHPDMLKTPGIEAPTGSLGMGLSYANGIAMAAKLDGLTFNIFLIVGDGELQEGQVWEAAMNTSCRRLNNVCVLVDRNRYQSQGNVEEIKSVEPLLDKWKAFGWDAVRIDGHDMRQICSALDRIDGGRDKPLAIIADTIKGKGVSFMEDTYKYHNFSISEDEYRRAVAELEQRVASFTGSGGL